MSTHRHLARFLVAWLGLATAAAGEEARPLSTLRSASITPGSCRPGDGARVTYHWEAAPLGARCSVFVHLESPPGRMIFQADHDPPVSTQDWSGKVDYARTITVPTDAPPGLYEVVVGLWDPRPADVGGGNHPFLAGEGLTSLPHQACRIGTLNVSHAAPGPTLPPKTLNLDAYRLTFDEDFQKPLDISAWGPGTRWIAHTPYAGDFGDAGFGDPGPDSPFSIHDGILQIEARKVGDRWRSGLICSVDPRGAGFSQKFGYFEMRAKLPVGPGTWPAFWLMGVPQLVEPKDHKTLTQIEIDVVEQYGVGPNALHTTVHLWGPGDFHRGEGDTTIVSGMTEGFHTYGASVEDDALIFYYDGAEIRRERTPDAAKVPLYLMVDLALGGGWPIDKTPNPSRMAVDYVRAYAKR